MKRPPNLHSEIRARFIALQADALPLQKPLLVLEELHEGALLKVLFDCSLAICVKNFLKKEVAHQIADKFLKASESAGYEQDETTEIEINGKVLMQSGSNRRSPRYFENALLMRRAIRKLLSPFVSPIDLMQAELDSVWRPGTQVLTLNGKKCHAGRQNCFRSGGEKLHQSGRAHLDFVHPKTARMTAELSMTSYLSTAAGGEVELWNISPDDNLYNAARVEGGSARVLRKKYLPPPDLVIRPEAGDLVIFNAAKLHHICPVIADGASVSVSAFAGFFSANEPLQIFS